MPITTGTTIEAQIGQAHRIVCRRNQACRTKPFRHAEAGREPEARGNSKRQRNGKSGEQISPQPEPGI